MDGKAYKVHVDNWYEEDRLINFLNEYKYVYEEYKILPIKE